MQVLVQILQLLGCLSLLVLVHEFGHFITAKMFGVRVEKFCLFFDLGHTLFRFKPKNSDTEYAVGWLPLGGYVKLSGMIDESLDTEQMKRPVQDWEFRSKPAWQRLIIMAAGVIMNFLLAIFIYAMLLFSNGESYVQLKDASWGMSFSKVAKDRGFEDGDILLMADNDTLVCFDEANVRAILNAKQVTVLRNGKAVVLPQSAGFMQELLASNEGFADFRIPFVVRGVVPASPADVAGLQAGDSLVSVNDVVMPLWSDMLPVLQQHAGDTIRVGFYREGQLQTLSLRLDAEGKMGVYAKPYFEIYPLHHRQFGFFESFPNGIERGWRTFSGYGSDFKLVFTKEGAQSLGGFGTITSLFPTSFSWQVFWYLSAYISIILAFMNLLPIPGLDGGHILFVLVELVIRRKLSTAFLIRMQKIGLLLLLFLLLYANGMDIIRAFT